MFEYSGFLIKTEPDYKEMIKKGEEIDELWCTVYDENDEQMEHCLGEFNMMCCYEFEEETVKSIEAGICKMIDDEYIVLQLKKENNELLRIKELFHKAVVYIKSTLEDEQIDSILQNKLEMTKAEIKDTLSELENTQEIKML